MFELLLTIILAASFYFVEGLFFRVVIFLFYLVLVLPGIYSMIFGAPFIRTSDRRLNAILELGKFKPDDVVYDLGCGDGKIIRAVSKSGVKKIIGYEFSFPTYLMAVLMKFFGKSHEIIRFGNFWKKDFSDADVLICFLLERTMLDFEKKIWPKLKSGTKVISNEFVMSKVAYDASKGMVFLYVKK
jgi:hypothetical protein